MPYKSEQQRKFFHSAGAKKAGITSATVKEYDKMSKGKKLPKHSCSSCGKKGHYNG